MTLNRKFYNFIIIFACFIMGIQTGCNQSKENNSAEEIKLIIKETKDKIIQNILNKDDIDFGLDFGRIESIMLSYKPGTGSSMVKINEKAYDLLILNELQAAYDNILSFWMEHRFSEISRLVNDSVNQMFYVNGFEDYDLAEAISYFSWQAEMSSSFFLNLFDLFHLRDSQDNSYVIRGLSILIPSLPIAAINIDDIPYDAITVNALKSNMEKRLISLKEQLAKDLIAETNIQYDIMVNNVEPYLDWYYSPKTDINRILRGIGDLPGVIYDLLPFTSDRNKLSFDQKYMLKNYIDIIGRGTSFEGIINILENERDKTLELALIFMSLLEESNLEFYYYTEVTDTIVGDNIMTSFIQNMDRLDILVFEGVPLLLGMGDGNMLDANTLALDLGVGAAATAIGFIPVVGIPLSIGMDVAWIIGGSSARENLTRADLKEKLISLLENSRESVINMLN